MLKMMSGLKWVLSSISGKSDYKTLKSLMPKTIDWSKLSEYESEDNTAGSQTLACSGDSCEIVDLV